MGGDSGEMEAGLCPRSRGKGKGRVERRVEEPEEAGDAWSKGGKAVLGKALIWLCGRGVPLNRAGQEERDVMSSQWRRAASRADLQLLSYM